MITYVLTVHALVPPPDVEYFFVYSKGTFVVEPVNQSLRTGFIVTGLL
jgi:hypothetical protein